MSAMEIDVQLPLKQALAKAKTFTEAKDWAKAASAYEKAAALMSTWAEQAHGREAEERRKKMAIEYRALAQRLRSGETTNDSSVRSSDSGSDKESAAKAGPGGEIKSIVSNLSHASKITWEDIGGLEETKNEIKFALGMTLAQHPAGVKIAAWTKILFYGPPGTGKTLLAAATSSAVRSTEGTPSVFYNVKVSSILSKYFGESSKIVSELYGTARDTSPSVVFLDEFESLAGQRDASDSGAERRILSTLLSELDGMDSKGRTDIYVLTIAATNRPWDLDSAVLSRFEKKILIPLPDEKTRERILQIHLGKKGFPIEMDYPDLAQLTTGYSGREIERFCKEVTTSMVEEVNRDIPTLVDQGLDTVKKYRIKVRPLSRGDFESDAKLIHPQTTKEEMQKYYNWKESAEER
ncbi:MAG: ATP-binding protein [Planctomycetota bacterium]|nr:MAG: ATP-binding protein [Planctomycetota bacterium]